MQFKIEQLALAPRNSAQAKQLLTDMGIGDWSEDTVVAEGQVFGKPGKNTADLSFNYTALKDAYELEVLNYKSGPNWIENRPNVVSHIGMHCTAAELDEWFKFFTSRGIRVAQSVFTQSHTNPVIDGKRLYNYVIFDTHEILGVDVKFIVRINMENPS